MAENAINSNTTILPNIRLTVLKMDGKCRADEVMKSFINIYMRHDRVLGVLGPACSETVEPIAGELFYILKFNVIYIFNFALSAYEFFFCYYQRTYF